MRLKEVATEEYLVMGAQEIEHPILDQQWYVVEDELGGYSIANVDKPVSELNQMDELNFINCRFKYVAERIVTLHNKSISF